MTCSSTMRVTALPDSDACRGMVRWVPAKSLWMIGMTGSAVVLAPLYVTPGAVVLWLALSALTLCLGHSIGLHRLLIHRSFEAPRWFARLLAYLGTLVGMAGPLGMVRLHDMRDWAQRQRTCHDLHAHRAPPLRDAWWQMHCRLDLTHPPRFRLDPVLADDAVLFLWGIAVRVAVGVTGHWLVGHITHRTGPQGWRIDDVAVQGHDLPAAALVTFGEAWHGNHHAWPESARLGVEPGQHDPGWWVLLGLRRIGLVRGLKEPAMLAPRAGSRRVA